MKKLLVLLLLFIIPLSLFAFDGVDFMFETSLKGSYLNLNESDLSLVNIEKSSIKFDGLFSVDIFGIENFRFIFNSAITYNNLMNNSTFSFKLIDYAIEYSSEDGSVRTGLYNNLIQVSPAKILKASELFDHLYYALEGDSKKTNFQFEYINKDFSFIVLYAPMYDWILESNNNYLISDLLSLHYLHGQYVNEMLGVGTYFGFESNYKNMNKYYVGGWGEFVLSDNFTLYSDFLWSSRNFVPYLNEQNFSMDSILRYKDENVIIASLGFANSFTFIPFTIYLETLFNSEGYYLDDFNALSDTVSFLDSSYSEYSVLAKSLLLRQINHNYYNKFTIGAHLRSDTAFWDLMKINLSILYHLPYSLVIYPELEFEFDFGLNVSLASVCVFDLNSSVINYSDFYPFLFRPEINISYSVYF